MNELKANTATTDSMIDSIIMINKQLQQTIVILHESIKIQAKSGIEPQNQLNTKVKQLLNQMRTLASWTSRQDADEMMISSLSLVKSVD